MFKKLKEKISDEVKLNPRLQGTLESVNQLAAQTYSAFNKEGSGSRDSLTSLTSLSSTVFGGENGESLPGETLNTEGQVNNGSFFSLGEDDDPVSLSNANSPSKTPTPAATGLTMTSTPTSGRGRRLSNSSAAGDAALFPIYEDPVGQEDVSLFSDLESTAGDSSAGWTDDGSAHLGAVSKEQLFNMLSKMRARYHKYKGRYSDLANAYRKLETENKKVKEVMQQTQDRALRRISEMREQATLERQAKAHLEEELRAELEEKEHIIATLNTKVTILKENKDEDKPLNQLVDLSLDSGHQEYILQNGDKKVSESESILQLPDIDNMSVKSEDSEKVVNLEDKVKRLESLLSKCKDNIKANKNKLSALTEVKDQLASQLELKENELLEEKSGNENAVEELNIFKSREAGEELQMAEAKLAMHREMIVKDEEIGSLRLSFTQEKEEKTLLEKEIENLHQEIKEMGHAQETLEKRMEEERKSAMEELSRGKEAALEQERQRIETEHKKEVNRELQRKEEEWQQKVKEIEVEERLGREELELRLAATSKSEEHVKQLLNSKKSLEEQLTASKKKVTELEKTPAIMNDLKANKIILEEKAKDYVKDIDVKKSTISGLESTIRKIKQEKDDMAKEKDQELTESIEALSKMDDSIKDYEMKIESVEKQLNHAHEEHKNNLENLKLQFKNNENMESSQINVLKESHRTEVTEKTAELERLEAKMIVLEESNKEFQDRLDINLESSMKTEEEYEERIKVLEINIKDCEENLCSKAEELRDANEKVEDLQNYLEKMQDFETKSRDFKELLDEKQLELCDANAELDGVKRVVDEKSSSKVEIDRELSSLRDQVNSRQALHDQMVGYEKELQSRVSTLENDKSELINEKENCLSQLQTCFMEIENIKTANEEELCKLKQDLDMKMRLEREKEHSHKEFQKQSIEYEKKLQDQLTEKDQLVEMMKKDLDQNKKDLTNIKESYEKELLKLEHNLNEVGKKVSQKELEARNMNEKCEQIENLLDEKEKIVIVLETSLNEAEAKTAAFESEIKELTENRTQLNLIIESKQSELLNLQNNQDEHEKVLNENKKLSKSRDRLKSLLDEKDKSFSELQGEKEKQFGSREEIDQQMKEKVSTLKEEIFKLSELNESLQSECNEIKTSLDTVNQEYSSKNHKYNDLMKDLEVFKIANQNLILEKDYILTEKKEVDTEVNRLKSLQATMLTEINELKEGSVEQEKLKNEVSQALLELKISGEEMTNLKIKLKQVEDLSHLTELKEENVMLTEQLNQFKEEKSELEETCEDRWRVENQKLQNYYDKEKLKLEKQIEQLEHDIESYKATNDGTDIDEKIKTFVKEFERKLALTDAEHQEELERLRDVQEIELNRINKEHRELTTNLNVNLRQQYEQLEIMEQEKEAAIRMVGEEAEERIEELQTQLNKALQEADSRREMRNSHSGDWEDGWDDPNDKDSPAIFGVPSHPHPANKPPEISSPVLSLEDYPEFEYLRNILFQYMMGRQPIILVKVLSAIVKFSPEQVDNILQLEEKKQSYLASFGLS